MAVSYNHITVIWYRLVYITPKRLPYPYLYRKMFEFGLLLSSLREPLEIPANKFRFLELDRFNITSPI